jgi:hypothetical protein
MEFLFTTTYRSLLSFVMQALKGLCWDYVGFPFDSPVDVMKIEYTYYSTESAVCRMTSRKDYIYMPASCL